MVVPRLQPQGQVNARLLARRLEQFGAQLFGEERVGPTLIDQDIARRALAILNQRDSIVRAPCSTPMRPAVSVAAWWPVATPSPAASTP